MNNLFHSPFFVSHFYFKKAGKSMKKKLSGKYVKAFPDEIDKHRLMSRYFAKVITEACECNSKSLLLTVVYGNDSGLFRF